MRDKFPFRHIEYYNAGQGLNGNEVSCITQDHNGFMWFITGNALNRYDGYSCRSYSYRSDDKNTLTLGWYWGLREDGEGKLWMCSQENGIYSFDPRTERFTHYRHRPGDNNSLVYDKTWVIEVDRKNCIWIATKKSLDKFDQQSKTFTHFFHDPSNSKSLAGDFIYAIVPDEKNDDILWLVNNKPGIDCFNRETGEVVKHFDFPFSPSLYNWDNPNIAVRGMKNGNIWLGSNDKGIFGFNAFTEEFIQIKIPVTCRSKKHIAGFYNVAQDEAGNLWTTHDNNEVIYYENAGKKCYSLPVEKDNIRFLDLASFIYPDNNQKVWLGTNNGLMTIDILQKNIYTCRHDDTDPNSISGNFVFGIFRTREGQLLVGTSARLDIFNGAQKTFSPFVLAESGKNIETAGTWTISQDSKGYVWMGGNSGVTSYNPFTQKAKHYQFHSQSETLSSVGTIGITEDRKGRYWAGNWGNGLYLIDPGTGKIRNFTISQGDHSSGTNGFGPLFIDSRGTLYVNGWDAGFVTFNPEEEKFRIYHHEPGNASSVSNENAHSFIETTADRQGLIWFATMGGGINVFDPATHKFTAFTTEQGLANNYVVSLTRDKNGDYWAGTWKGISRFTPPADPFKPDCKIVFRNYDVSDGLSSNVLNYISSFCDTDGTLYFGTRNSGMFYFHPDSLKDSPFIPPVFITDLRIRNKEMSLYDSTLLKLPIEITREIRLSYRQNMVSFTFTALNYIHPEKNKYAYQLEGLDKDWIITDASKRFASYTNLSPGSYVFKVKASNNDGIWNETPTELRITITPPFWQTAWFRVGILILAGGLLYLFYRYRIGQILLLQRIRNKIAEDLHDDIGSTLNSISVLSEVARKDSTKRDNALKMIGESSRKIIESMSDIVWSINPQNDSFDKIIFRMRSLSYNLLKLKKIECDFYAEDGLSELKLPLEIRRNFYLIFKEALNNLVKYSRAANASILISSEYGSITCIIRDDGVGFDCTQEYAGNGLGNMKKRAREINAALVIDSAIGKGTSIELNLKI